MSWKSNHVDRLLVVSFHKYCTCFFMFSVCFLMFHCFSFCVCMFQCIEHRTFENIPDVGTSLISPSSIPISCICLARFSAFDMNCIGSDNASTKSIEKCSQYEEHITYMDT